MKSHLQWLSVVGRGGDPPGTPSARRNGAPQPSQLPIVTVEELSRHASLNDLWIALRGRVYDVTAYVDCHPGGIAQIMSCAGRDGTVRFEAVHPWVAVEALLRPCLVGLYDASAAGEAASITFAVEDTDVCVELDQKPFELTTVASDGLHLLAAPTMPRGVRYLARSFGCDAIIGVVWQLSATSDGGKTFARHLGMPLECVPGHDSSLFRRSLLLLALADESDESSSATGAASAAAAPLPGPGNATARTRVVSCTRSAVRLSTAARDADGGPVTTLHASLASAVSSGCIGVHRTSIGPVGGGGSSWAAAWPLWTVGATCYARLVTQVSAFGVLVDDAVGLALAWPLIRAVATTTAASGLSFPRVHVILVESVAGSSTSRGVTAELWRAFELLAHEISSDAANSCGTQGSSTARCATVDRIEIDTLAVSLKVAVARGRWPTPDRGTVLLSASSLYAREFDAAARDAYYLATNIIVVHAGL